jgi:hypothetical protein
LAKAAVRRTAALFFYLLTLQTINNHYKSHCYIKTKPMSGQVQTCRHGLVVL